MDYFLIILGGLLLLTGLVGAVMPIIPGPPISFFGVLAIHFSSWVEVPTKWLWILGIAALVITILDYIIPSYFSKKYGAHWFSSLLAFAGMLVGLLFPPLGLIIGPFIGALIGEIIIGRAFEQGIKSAWATFLGFIFSTMLKLMYAFIAIVIIVKFRVDESVVVAALSHAG
ncbi:MAG: DUF456 domain-containing protein [Flavobacteriales bacterium]|nr:MAG: DUF456 domain-containing protein [Flavobacteriales bacterium]